MRSVDPEGPADVQVTCVIWVWAKALGEKKRRMQTYVSNVCRSNFEKWYLLWQSRELMSLTNRRNRWRAVGRTVACYSPGSDHDWKVVALHTIAGNIQIDLIDTDKTRSQS